MAVAIRPIGSLRVLLAEDHVVLRQALRTLLQYEGFLVVGEVSNGRDAVAQCARLQPEVAVLDLSMPVLNGVEAARAITLSSPRTRIVLLAGYLDDRILEAGTRAGVKGCVSRVRAPQELVSAIRTVHAGGCYGLETGGAGTL